MKTKLIMTGLMFVLLSSIAFATSAYTEYSGSGDFQLQTNIQSEVTPTIYDSATIHTGCNGGCCCCPGCSGEYEGIQVVTNNPFSIAIDNADVTNGCVVLEQTIYDKFDDRNAETRYYTYLDGTGTATSYIYATPGQGYSYQLSNGTGSTFASFSQIVFLNDNFDYETTYGGGTWVCGPGYTGMVNAYDFYNHKGYYNPQLGLYCYPINEDSSLYAFLFAETTDYFGLDANFTIDSSKVQHDVEAEGASEYGTVATSYKNLSFDFDMRLG